MKHLTQNVEVTFSAPSFKDAIALVDVMNMLAFTVNENKNLSLISGELHESNTSFKMTSEAARKIYNILNEMGFESTVEIKKED